MMKKLTLCRLITEREADSEDTVHLARAKSA